jgi:hypothetical protein
MSVLKLLSQVLNAASLAGIKGGSAGMFLVLVSRWKEKAKHAASRDKKR